MPIKKTESQEVSKKENALKKSVKKPTKTTRKKSTKTTQKTPAKKVWRPTVMTPEILNKLQEAFLMGCTDAEACLYAEIEPRTLYKFQDENPEFIHKKEYWKQNPILKARAVVMNSIASGDESTAKWYLERKAKAEFSTKSEIGLTDKNGEDILITPLDTLNNLLKWNAQ